MYGLHVLDEFGWWQPIQLEWQEQEGWHFRRAAHPGQFLFFKDAEQAAQRIAHHCRVTVAVMDTDQVHQVFVARPRDGTAPHPAAPASPRLGRQARPTPSKPGPATVRAWAATSPASLS